ncbi:DNA helicase [Tanacetum coccineum]
MMLCHQKGYRDFPEVQTVHDIFYPSCRAACEALGLLGDDNEWDITMQEAYASGTLSQLRFVFTHILTHCEKAESVSRLNGPHRKIYDLIIDTNAANQQELIFVYGHGGTGKTFLWKTIISALHSKRKSVLAVALSGIASLLLPSDRTAHSRGKSVLLGKDFRQTLLVKKGALKMEVIASCVSKSDMWLHFRVFTLIEDMRLSRPGVSADER